jgi:formylglycine-generating enzyme required for sulfatase activity
MELRALHGGPTDDPEAIPKASGYKPQAARSVPENRKPTTDNPVLPGWPFDAAEAQRRQAALGATEKPVDLGGGVTLTLVRVPAGEFPMGEPPARVKIEKPFWIGKFEVTNEQFRRFDPAFDPGYYVKLHARSDDQGLPLNGPKQPAVRVPREQAMAFCRWLSQRTGLPFTLPTEAQWEWACRAGTATPLFYGGLDADFSRWANVGDRAYAAVKNDTGGIEHLDPSGRALCDTRFDDHAAATAPVGTYEPNPWGLHDTHGNAAEWTLCEEEAGVTHHASRVTRYVVRGGSFYDRPARCRSDLRLAYPPWQRVFNVGFRVACSGL